MAKPELSRKKFTISYDGMPPQTSTERTANKYPDNDDLPVPQQSEIFES